MSEKSLSSKIDQLIRVISSREVAPIAPVAPVLPIAPVRGDYDNTLLIKVIDTKVDRLILDVSNIDKNYSLRIEKLEKEKAEKIELEEHKKGNEEILNKIITTKDTQTVLLSIGIGLIVILASMLIYHLFNIKI